MVDPSFLTWFCKSMGANKLIVRGEVAADGSSADISFWTQHHEDDVIWGGAHYRYNSHRPYLGFTIFPLLQDQVSCARQATQDWPQHRGWCKTEPAIFSLETEPRYSAGNPIILTHVSRAHGMIEIASEVSRFDADERALSRSLANRVGGLVGSACRDWRALI